MTAPSRTEVAVKAPVVKRDGPTGGSSGGAFGAPTPPDHRTTALQSAVAVLRGKAPAAKAAEVLEMAEAFYQFLKKGNG